MNETLSSNDFCPPASVFRPHGQFRIWHDGRLLRYEADGPFNVEAIRALGGLRREAARRWVHPGTPVATLIHWQHSALMSPEAFEQFRAGFHQFISSAVTGGLVAVAWVAEPQLEGMDIMVSKFRQPYAEAGTRFELFSHIETARAWLEQQLDQAAPQR